MQGELLQYFDQFVFFDEQSLSQLPFSKASFVEGLNQPFQLGGVLNERPNWAVVVGAVDGAVVRVSPTREGLKG